MKKGLCLLLVCMFLVSCFTAISESDTWTCPSCGLQGNIFKFCPNCGTSKPEATSNEEGGYAIGDVVTFGKYEQDGVSSNGKEDIEWIILDRNENDYLLISKYTLVCRGYNAEYAKMTWEICTLRSWLNKQFYNDSFSDAEKSHILTTEVTADPNPNSLYVTAGNNTQDKVFILSVNEAEKYFEDEEHRISKPTKAVKQIYYGYEYYGSERWWLRTVGGYQDFACYVDSEGYVLTRGTAVQDSYGIRPCIWATIY